MGCSPCPIHRLYELPASVLVTGLGLVLLTQLHVYVSGCWCVHVRSAYVVEHQHLDLFPVTVADSSLRKASSGGVAASNPCSSPVLIRCRWPRLHVHEWSVSFVVIDPLHLDGRLLGLFKTLFLDLFSRTFIFLYHSVSCARAFLTSSDLSS